MYKYIRNYSKDRENGWSEEVNGVCHDSSNWFFTQDGNIWKFPLKHDLNDSCKKSDLSEGIRKVSTGKQLGDFDYYKGFLFIPVTEKEKSYIAVYRSSDLSYVTKQQIEKFGNAYNAIGWCAVNPLDGRLYTSDRDIRPEFNINTSPVMVYDIKVDNIKSGSSNFLEYKTYIVLYSENGTALEREYVQGGCFDEKNHLHITNGYYTIKGGSHNWANEKGGISVFTIPNISNKGRYEVSRIACSNQSKGFRFQFNGTGEEPQGITYWNLTSSNAMKDIRGQLHAIMIDNCGTGDDDFFFKHYSIDSTFVEPKPALYKGARKRGVIITTVIKDDNGKTQSIGENDRREDNRVMMRDLFRKRGIDYTIIVDYNISGIKKIIKSVFGDSNDTDWNYTYINCHGSNGGLALGYDGTRDDYRETHISYSSLKNEYSGFKGKKIFLVDSCHSGSASGLSGTNNYILCSAKATENAQGDNVFGNWATRYWSDGAGNDFLKIKDKLYADSNKNGRVTLNELRDYTNKKLKQNSRPQQCVSYPANSNEVIF